MQLTIDVPIKADIVSSGFQVAVARQGEVWLMDQLGDYANRRGVYIHHSNGTILYVGKATTGEWGKFGECLSREFQMTAGLNSRIHQLLDSQPHPIGTYLLDLGDIDMMVNPGSMQLSRERKALIMEQVLIGLYDPIGNLV